MVGKTKIAFCKPVRFKLRSDHSALNLLGHAAWAAIIATPFPVRRAPSSAVPRPRCLSSSAMDYDDTADLLGNNEMPIVRPQQSAIGSFFSFRTFALLLLLVLTGALARMALTDMLPWVKRLKDQAARK